METKKAIEERRSIRSYKDKELTKEIVEDILNCGRLAPSAKNRQPWYFVVVKNEIKDKIADMMKDYTLNNNDNNRLSSVASSAKAIKQAPILILIFKEKDDNWLIGDNLSIGACVENMCIRATDLGIGSLWIRDIVYVAKDVARMIGHPNMDLNCALSLGYANQEPEMRPRKKLEDMVEWYNG